MSGYSTNETFDVTVRPGSETGAYYILVANLPKNTAWQTLKNFVVPVCPVEWAMVYPGQNKGWVRVNGEENFQRAFSRLYGGRLGNRELRAKPWNKNQAVSILMNQEAYLALETEPAPPGQFAGVTGNAQGYEPTDSNVAYPANPAEISYSESQYDTSQGHQVDEPNVADAHDYHQQPGEAYESGPAESYSATGPFEAEESPGPRFIVVRGIPGRERRFTPTKNWEIVSYHLGEIVSKVVSHQTVLDTKFHATNAMYVEFGDNESAVAARDKLHGVVMGNLVSQHRRSTMPDVQLSERGYRGKKPTPKPQYDLGFYEAGPSTLNPYAQAFEPSYDASGPSNQDQTPQELQAPPVADGSIKPKGKGKEPAIAHGSTHRRGGERGRGKGT